MIVWIASYPKSGNTWVRAFLTSYFYSDDGMFNFELLENIKEFPRQYFENISNEKLSKGILKESTEWANGQKKMSMEKNITFLKTHSSLCNIGGNSFINRNNTLGIIYIVRDPRNVITSFSNHYDKSIDESLKFMTNKNTIASSKKQDINYGYTFYSDWQNHYNSWKEIKKIIPIIIIKYEDLIDSANKVFSIILSFLGGLTEVNINEEKMKNAVNSTNFKKLRNMEEKFGFKEMNKMGFKNKFFNLGKDNSWKNLLSKEVVEKIEKLYHAEMKELGYL